MSLPSPSSLPLGRQEEYIGDHLIIVTIVFLVLALVLFILRIVAQSLTQRTQGFDDYFLWGGIATLIGFGGICIALPSVAGFGYHEQYILETDPQAISVLPIYIVTATVLYICSCTFTKISILGLYLRILISKWSRRLVYVLIGFTAATWLALIPVVFAQCRPFAAHFNGITSETTCINQQRFYQFISLPSIVADVIMLFLPVPVIMRIQITTMQKIGLTFSFLMGSIGLVAATVRFAEFSVNDLLDDFTWIDSKLSMWSFIEPSMYAAAACLLTLRPLVHEVRKKLERVQISSKTHSKYMKTNEGWVDLELSRIERGRLGRERITNEDLDMTMPIHDSSSDKQGRGNVIFQHAWFDGPNAESGTLWAQELHFSSG